MNRVSVIASKVILKVYNRLAVRMSNSRLDNMLMPCDAGRLIAETSKDVTVCQDGVKKVAQMVYDSAKKSQFCIERWAEHELNPTSRDRAAVDWVFVVDILNFSFWPADEAQKYSVEYNGKSYTGYWSLCAVINRALKEGIPITDPSYYSTISLEKLAHIFRSEHEIPLMEERLQVLTEAGKVLVQKYDGSFINCIKRCENSAQALLKLLVTEFHSLQDEADYNGKRVAFYKRAQILVADVWAACAGQGLGDFHDIHTITMFADYRIPQVLAFYGALKYSENLMKQLKQDTELRNGDRLEVEIRGCTIWACELVNQEVQKLLTGDPALKDTPCNSIMVDHYLWNHRRELADKMSVIPYHKVRCIYY